MTTAQSLTDRWYDTFLANLRLIRRPALRAEEIARALAAVEKIRQSLIDLRDDTALELHDVHRVPWDRVARRFGTPMQTIYRSAKKREAQLGTSAAARPADDNSNETEETTWATTAA